MPDGTHKPLESISVAQTLHPLRQEVVHARAAPGKTLAELLELLQPDPILRAHSHVSIDGEPIERDEWPAVYPEAGQHIEMKVVPRGGEGDKNPLRVILSIAAVALSFSTFGATLGAALGFKGTAAAVIGNTLVVVGSTVLIDAIAPLRAPNRPQDPEQSPNYSIDTARNRARLYQPIPVVFGTHRMTPPLGAKTYTELVGDNQYLRMLVVWGYGPLKIRNIKIGETDIADYDDVQIETREGYDTDDALTLFPSDVNEQAVGTELTSATSWVTRTTTETEVDEISVDLTFPQGLAVINDQGNRTTATVRIEVAYRKVGETAWVSPNIGSSYQVGPPGSGSFGFDDYGAASTFGDFTGGANEGTLVIRHARTVPIREGARWRVPERAQYEVRLRRTTADTTDDRTFDGVYWTVLRTFIDEPPITSRRPLAMTALSIRATDQLNGIVDELNAEVSAVVPDWDGSAWTDAETSNPASGIRHVLTGPARDIPSEISELNDEALQRLHTFCVDNDFQYNEIRDYRSSVYQAISDIAAAGRGSPQYADGTWGTVWDSGTQSLTQHFTPRNSSNFTTQRHFLRVPEGFRVQFKNRDEGWRNDERIVYADGQDASTAEKFGTLEPKGITDPDHIWKYGRYHLANLLLRRETWSWDADFEYLVATRGSRIKLTHDVILVGLASARILSATMNASGEFTGMTVDETVTMEAGTDYGVSIRTTRDIAVTAQVTTVAGDTKSLAFTAPFSTTIAAGDLLAFGELGSETVDALVTKVEPRTEISARVTAMPWSSPGVYDADTSTIPAYDTGLTPLSTPDDLVIISVRSDLSALALQGNTWRVRIVIEVEPLAEPDPNAFIEAQLRVHGTDEQFYNASIESQTPEGIVLTDVGVGQAYDIRLRWRRTNSLLGSRWTVHSNHVVAGDSEAPETPTGLSVNAIAGGYAADWTASTAPDYRYTEIWQAAENGAFADASLVARTAGTVYSRVDIDPVATVEAFIRHVDQSGNEGPTAHAQVTTEAALDADAITAALAGSQALTDAVDDALMNNAAYQMLDDEIMRAEDAADEAEQAALNAGASETAADGSATAAAGSATTASSQATAASGSASSAATSASASAASASTATSQASAASTSATSASASATTATEQATAANVSATDAATSEANASTSATQASASETNADGSASAAATSALEAAASAGDAATAVAGIDATVAAAVDDELNTTLAAALVLRAQAGDALANLELVALSDLDGTASAVKIRADQIFLGDGVQVTADGALEVGDLSADNITTGTLSADRISGDVRNYRPVFNGTQTMSGSTTYSFDLTESVSDADWLVGAAGAVHGNQTIWTPWTIAVADIAAGISPGTTNMIGVASVTETFSVTEIACSLATDGETLYLRKEGTGSQARTHKIGRISAVFDPSTTAPATGVTTLILSTQEIMVREGETESVTVKLTQQPTADVSVSWVIGDTDLISTIPFGPLTIAQANWNTEHLVGITGLVDTNLVPNETTLTFTGSGGDVPSDAETVVDITVKEPRRLVINGTPANASISVAEGGSTTFDVRLSEEPTGNVTVTVSESDTDITRSPSTLTFTQDNWETDQEVTITGVQDADTADDSATVSLSATGGDFGGVTASVSVTIVDDDSAVTLTASIPAVSSVNEGTTRTHSVTVGGTATGAITYAWSITGDGTISGSSTGATVSVAAGSVGSGGGSYTVSVTVTRGGLSRSDSEIVTVNDVPVAITLTATIPAVGSVNEGTSTSHSVTVGGTATGAITYSWSVSGDGTISGSSTGSTVTVVADSVGSGDGSYTVSVSITRGGLSASDSESVTVNDVPVVTLPDAVAPTVTIAAVSSVDEDDTQALSVSLSGGTYDDVDSYTWAVDSGGGTITGSGASVTYNPPNVASNTAVTVSCSVQVSGDGTTAKDNTTATGSDTESFTVNYDSMPSLGSENNRTGTVGVIFFAGLSRASGGDAPLSYSVTGLPSWAAYSESTSSITGTPNAAGSHSITYTVEDDDGDTDSVMFTITIDPPAATPLGANAGNDISIVDDIRTEISDSSSGAGSGGSPPYSYSWSRISGTTLNVSITGLNSQTLTVTATRNSETTLTWIFELTVTDSDNNTATDRVTISYEWVSDE